MLVQKHRFYVEKYSTLILYYTDLANPVIEGNLQSVMNMLVK